MDGQRQLFPSAPYMSDKARYPRGYTPERQAAVRSALSGTQFRTSPEAYEEPAAFERMAVDALARSTMKTEHMTGVSSLDTPRGSGITDSHGQYNTRSKSILMPYEMPGNTHRSAYADISRVDGIPTDLRHSRMEAEQTLLHEMGHHLSFHHGGRSPQTRFLDAHGYTKDNRAYHQEEEAYADDHMVKHFRPHPKDVEAQSSFKTVSYYAHGNATDRETPHYVAARKHWAPDEQRLREGLRATESLGPPVFPSSGGRTEEMRKGAKSGQMKPPGMRD